MKKLLFILIITISGLIIFNSCHNQIIPIIEEIKEIKITAKDRLDTAIALATQKYGQSIKLVLVLGQNVIYSGADKGKIDVFNTVITADPNTLGAWIYVFKIPGTDTLKVYTPNPTPRTKDCWELTKYFNLNTLLAIIPDTSVRNIISGTISEINNPSFKITTGTSALVNSDASLDYANITNPIIRFDSSFVPGSSSLNGNFFFNNDTAGYTKSVNMFLIPAAGALNLQNQITELTGFPNDLWIVNFKKTSCTTTNNLVLGTVVQCSQIMGIPSISLLSKCINLSKYTN